MLRARDASLTPWIAIGGVLLVSGLLLFHLSHGTTFWLDEWTWALDRRGNDVGTFLRPHNGHLSLIPVAIYRVLFATAGLGDYTPYRAVLVVGEVICGALIFVYVHRRAGTLFGVLATLLVLFLGPAWQDLLWPFQVGWMISLAGGVGALLALDRGDRAGDWGACVLVGVSIASSGIGLPITLGVIVDLLWARRSLRGLWIVGVPLFFFGVWWLNYQDNNFITLAHALGVAHPITSGILRAPRFSVDSGAASLGALSGLEGPQLPDAANTGQSLLDWGIPLAVVATSGLAWRLRHLPQVSPRLLCLLTIPVSFWIFTSITRSFISAPYTSRYLLVGAIFLLLLAAELARGSTRSGLAQGLACAGVAAAIAANVGVMRDAANYLRRQAVITRASVAGLDLGRPLVKADFSATAVAFGIQAGSYYSTEKVLGTPAYTERELETAAEPGRLTADAEFVRIHAIEMQPAIRPVPLARVAPAVDAVGGGAVQRRGACAVFTPPGVAAAGSASDLQLTVPATGVEVSVGVNATKVSVRRFADEFATVGTLRGGSKAILRIAADRASRPWHLDLAGSASATVCTLS